MRNSSLIPLAFLTFSFSFSACAQAAEPKPRLRYFLSIHSGGLFGKKPPTFTTEFMQGLCYRRIRLGVGPGYDVYTDWRTVPLLASLSWDVFSIRGNSFFTQLSGGYSWIRSPIVRDSPVHFYDGPNPCVSGVAGYRVRSGKHELYFSAGYKFQRIRYGATQQWPAIQTLVQLDVERMTVNIGFGI